MTKRVADMTPDEYRRNAEYRREYNRRWREVNREKVRADERARYARNRDERCAYMREHRRRNPDMYREVNRRAYERSAQFKRPALTPEQSEQAHRQHDRRRADIDAFATIPLRTPWSIEEDETVLSWQGSVADLAIHLGRTLRSTEAHRYRLLDRLAAED